MAPCSGYSTYIGFERCSCGTGTGARWLQPPHTAVTARLKFSISDLRPEQQMHSQRNRSLSLACLPLPSVVECLMLPTDASYWPVCLCPQSSSASCCPRMPPTGPSASALGRLVLHVVLGRLVLHVALGRLMLHIAHGCLPLARLPLPLVVERLMLPTDASHWPVCHCPWSSSASCCPPILLASGMAVSGCKFES